MKYLFIIVPLLILSCNQDSPRELSEGEKKLALKTKNDSLMVIYDSLLSIKIDIPQIIDKSIIDSTCSQQFIELAKRTDGNVTLLLNAKFISKEIVKIIENNSSDNADILFLIDKTQSMTDDLENIKKGLSNIISSIKKYKNNRLAIACYGDKNADSTDWFNFKNFEQDYSGANSFVNSIKAYGGGDYPESVYDGFFEAMKQDFWRSDSKRIIILIGDAPSLAPPLSTHTIEDVIQKAKEYKINMNFYPILISPYDVISTDSIRRMEEIKLIENVFPNPSNGLVTIDLVKSDEYEVEIFNQNGSLIQTQKMNGDSYKNDMYELPNGIYIFRVSDKNKNFDSRKIILQK